MALDARVRPRYAFDMRGWLLSLVAVALTACPATQTRPPPGPDAAPSGSTSRAASNPSPVRDPGPAFERFAMPGVQGLIVGESEAGRFYDAIRGESSPRYWVPEKSQLIDLESRLMAYLRSAAPSGSRLRSGLGAYRRQYIGIVRDDREVVFVSFFCETLRQDWTRKPIVVDDGGDCYFRVEYDPQTHKFSHLEINGEA